MGSYIESALKKRLTIFHDFRRNFTFYRKMLNTKIVDNKKVYNFSLSHLKTPSQIFATKSLISIFKNFDLCESAFYARYLQIYSVYQNRPDDSRYNSRAQNKYLFYYSITFY